MCLKGLHNDSRAKGASRIDATAGVADLECASLRIRKEECFQNQWFEFFRSTHVYPSKKQTKKISLIKKRCVICLLPPSVPNTQKVQWQVVLIPSRPSGGCPLRLRHTTPAGRWPGIPRRKLYPQSYFQQPERDWGEEIIKPPCH